MKLSAESIQEIKERASKYPRNKSAILPALTVACKQFGFVNDAVYQEISRVLNVPYVDIAEAATFYTMFPKAPVGKYLIQVCHNISCALLASDAMIEYIESKLGIKRGETTADKLFTLISVECLGSCATAPMMQINDDFYENLTRTKVDQILAELRSKG